MFPMYLSTQFEAVYTAEPELDNFWCLVTNCATARNIYAFRCAFGEDAGSTALNVTPTNAGGHFIGGHGHLPMIRIDDLGLAACDLLALDIEGAEFMALKGATGTIEKYRPLIVTEDKGHDVERFGASKGECHAWLNARNYKLHGFIGRDSVWLP
jgi:FkbM family methyltransferase